MAVVSGLQVAAGGALDPVRKQFLVNLGKSEFQSTPDKDVNVKPPTPLPPGVSEADIQDTMQENGWTREEVLSKLGVQ